MNRSARVVELLLWLIAAIALLAAPRLAPTASEAALDAPPAKSRARGEWRVVTWNVGGSANGTAHPLADSDLEAVAKTLRELRPDLVLLQEFRYGTQWDALRARFEVGAGYVQSAADDVAIVAVRGALADGRSSGLFAQARWQVDGHEFAVGALHAAAWSARERRREIGGALDRTLQMTARAHLFGGDLNLDVDQRGDLFSNDPQRDAEVYNYVAERLLDAGAGRGPTAEPDRRLDYLFVSREFEVRAAGPWKGRRSGTMDHDPLVVDLRLR